MHLRVWVCLAGLLVIVCVTAYWTTPTAATPTPEEILLNERNILDMQDVGEGCVTISGAVENANPPSNIEFEPPFIRLNPLVQSAEFPDFEGVSLSASLAGVLENDPDQALPTFVTVSFAYIPYTYAGMPVVMTNGSFENQRGEPSAAVQVRTFIRRPNEPLPYYMSFQFNSSGDVYLEAKRDRDVIEFRTAFDFSAETLDGERVRARGAMVALQDFESQSGITATPSAEVTPSVDMEAGIQPCPFN